MNLLAVDDDEFILELLPLILREEGHRDIVMCSTAENAMEIIRRTDRGSIVSCSIFRCPAWTVSNAASIFADSTRMREHRSLC